MVCVTRRKVAAAETWCPDRVMCWQTGDAYPHAPPCCEGCQFRARFLAGWQPNPCACHWTLAQPSRDLQQDLYSTYDISSNPPAGHGTLLRRQYRPPQCEPGVKTDLVDATQELQVELPLDQASSRLAARVAEGERGSWESRRRSLDVSAHVEMHAS